MNRPEAQAAFEIADNQAIDLAREDLGIFWGFGLSEFVGPVHVTLRQVARLMRWQGLGWDGRSWDADALNEVIQMGRKRFLILDGQRANA
jgi:hypothetical protein